MFDWQYLVVALVVAIAAAYVGRVLWQSVTSESGGSCGSCRSCEGNNDGPKVKPLVTLDDPPR